MSAPQALLFVKGSETPFSQRLPSALALSVDGKTTETPTIPVTLPQYQATRYRLSHLVRSCDSHFQTLFQQFI